jgi:hypothetical protein
MTKLFPDKNEELSKKETEQKRNEIAKITFSSLILGSFKLVSDCNNIPSSK